MNTPPQLDAQGYRKFGLTTGSIIGLLFGLFFPWLFERPIPWWPWIIGAVLVVWALVLPKTLSVIYGPWMRFGHIIGTINTKIILTVLFFLVFTPVAMVLRLMGKDMMHRKIDDTVGSYWQDSEKQDVEHMERSY